MAHQSVQGQTAEAPKKRGPYKKRISKRRSAEVLAPEKLEQRGRGRSRGR